MGLQSRIRETELIQQFHKTGVEFDGTRKRQQQGIKLLWSALLNGVGRCVKISRLRLPTIVPVERKNQETVSVLCLHETIGILFFATTQPTTSFG